MLAIVIAGNSKCVGQLEWNLFFLSAKRMSTYLMIRGSMGIDCIVMKLNGFLMKFNENCEMN